MPFDAPPPFDADALRPFDVRSLKPFDPAAPPELPKPAFAVPVDRELILRRRVEQRRLIDAQHVANAADQLGRLPDADESFHCVMKGNYPAWSLIPAVLRLAAPATITHLWIATLGTNNANTEELCRLLDARSIGGVSFLISCYFRDSTEVVFGALKAQLEARGQKVAAARNHAKIQCSQLSDGRCVVVESSANLRSCNNLEQFTMTQSAELLRFHAGWIDDVLALGDAR